MRNVTRSHLNRRTKRKRNAIQPRRPLAGDLPLSGAALAKPNREQKRRISRQ